VYGNNEDAAINQANLANARNLLVRVGVLIEDAFLQTTNTQRRTPEAMQIVGRALSATLAIRELAGQNLEENQQQELHNPANTMQR
jgi:hypothetical protein